MAPHGVYHFGLFALDARTRRVTCRGEPVAMAPPQFDVLLALLSRSGEVVSKETLIAAAWPGVAVTDNSLEQAISRLRRLLGDTPDTPLIETVPRRGYRWRGEVARRLESPAPAALSQELAPWRAWVEGRAALERLEVHALPRARAAFESAVAERPDWVEAHVGLANAHVMRYESTRADEEPDQTPAIVVASTSA
jgi:DNA-binding winged helix-turn-helix (wHTH) protein